MCVLNLNDCFEKIESKNEKLKKRVKFLFTSDDVISREIGGVGPVRPVPSLKNSYKNRILIVVTLLIKN